MNTKAEIEHNASMRPTRLEELASECYVLGKNMDWKTLDRSLRSAGWKENDIDVVGRAYSRTIFLAKQLVEMP